MFDVERSWTRREFLKLAGRAGLLSVVPTLASAAAALDSDTVCISILHTTDLHGHILPTSDYDGNSDRGGMARWQSRIRLGNRDVYERAAEVANAGTGGEHDLGWKAGRRGFRFETSVCK